MLLGAFPYVICIQNKPMFNAIDALMLCAMIHKCSLDIFHPGNEQNISQKNGQADHAFQNGDYPSGCNVLPQYIAQKIRKNHKYDNRKNYRKCNRQIHKQFILLLLLCNCFLCQLHLCLFFLFKKARRKHQCLHPQDKGIYKIEDTSYKRNLHQRLTWNYTLVLLYIYRDLFIRFPDRHRILITILHHDAFQNCLSAYVR